MFEYTFNVLVEFAQKLQRFSTNTLGAFTHAVLSDLPYWVAPVVFEDGFIHPSIHPSLCLSASPPFGSSWTKRVCRRQVCSSYVILSRDFYNRPDFRQSLTSFDRTEHLIWWTYGFYLLSQAEFSVGVLILST